MMFYFFLALLAIAVGRMQWRRDNELRDLLKVMVNRANRQQAEIQMLRDRLDGDKYLTSGSIEVS